MTHVMFLVFLVGKTSLHINQIAETITEDQKAFVKSCVNMYV